MLLILRTYGATVYDYGPIGRCGNRARFAFWQADPRYRQSAVVKILREQGAVTEYQPTVIQPSFFYNLWSHFQPDVATHTQLP